MAGRLSFSFAKKTFNSSPVGNLAADSSNLLTKITQKADSVDETTLKRYGFTMSHNEFPNEYLFTRMGGWSVVFRSSIIRVNTKVHPSLKNVRCSHPFLLCFCFDRLRL